MNYVRKKPEVWQRGVPSAKVSHDITWDVSRREGETLLRVTETSASSFFPILGGNVSNLRSLSKHASL